MFDIAETQTSYIRSRKQTTQLIFVLAENKRHILDLAETHLIWVSQVNNQLIWDLAKKQSSDFGSRRKTSPDLA